VTVKNAVFWDVTPCGCSKKRRSCCFLAHIVFLRSVLRLLVAANVPSAPIFATLMMEAMHSSETPVLTRASWRSIPEDGILQQVI
jgi:hypothetical protein